MYIAGDYNLNYATNDRTYFKQIEAGTGIASKIRDIARIASNTCIDNILPYLEGTHIVTKISISDHLGL